MKQLSQLGIIFTFLLGLGLLATTNLYAQNPPPPPPPPPARDYFPNTWSQYESKEGRFRIRFPGKPQETITQQETKTGKIDVHRMDYKGLMKYSVSYVEYAKSLDDPATAKDLLRGVRTGALEGGKDQSLLIIKEKEVTVNGHPGYFLHIELNGKTVGRIQWVLVANRLYSIVVECRKASANELEGKDDFEKVAMGFINSFEIIPQ